MASISPTHSNAQAALENMTVSNSVNVLLGLGIPWLIGSVYHRVAPRGKGAYEVPTRGLTFSVALYCGVGGACALFQVYRRYVVKADFGGGSKALSYVHAASLVGLWVLYVVLACDRSS